MRTASISPRSTPRQEWSLDLLQQLDWKRFEELTRMIVTKGGYRAEVVSVSPQADVSLSIYNGGGRRKPDAMIRCPQWEKTRVGEDQLRLFFTDLLNRGLKQGTFITPGLFSSAAAAYARDHDLELIDGPAYLEMLERLAPEDRLYLLKLATAGEFFVPTCPLCGGKMEQRQSDAPHSERLPRKMTFRKSETVSLRVRCNKLTIGKRADVQFLKEVHAMNMVIRGRTVGNFTCNGTVNIEPSGTVIGLVAARAVHLAPGGTLDGEMKILNTREILPIATDPQETFWGCRNHPRCPAVLKLREPDSPHPSQS
jgi:hypothetical protein